MIILGKGFSYENQKIYYKGKKIGEITFELKGTNCYCFSNVNNFCSILDNCLDLTTELARVYFKLFERNNLL
jgi:hypothetical protein